MKKVVLIIAAILVVSGVSVFAGAYAASGFDITKLGTEEYVTNEYLVSGSFSDICINAHTTDVAIKRSADQTCKIICSESSKIKHEVKVDGETLTIKQTDSRKWYDKLSFFGKSFSVTVYLNESAYNFLKIENSTGDVAVADGFSFNSIDISATTGDVCISGIAARDIKIKASTGDISLKNSVADSIDVSVTTGDVELNAVDCGGKATVKVSTGDFEANDLICLNLFSDGSTGDVALSRVTVTERLEIKRSTGDVSFDKIDANEINIETTTGDVSGTFLSDKIFFARSTTGSVNVPKTTSGGICEISTSTGDIRIDISSN